MTTFKKIYIEVTNCCNLTCSFCHHTDRPKMFMSAKVFKEIVEKISGNTGFISLHVLGEPLLHPDFERLLAICHDFGLRVNLTTNGTLLARHWKTLLTAPALRQISISLHSLAQVDKLAGDMHLNEIIDFAKEASRKTSLYISLRLWNLLERQNAGEDAWNETLLERLKTSFALPAIHMDALREEQGIPLAPKVFLNPEHQFTWPHPSSADLGSRGYCRGLRDHLAILVDGTVVPCCLDADGLLALGNICQHSLEEILAGPRARQISEGFVNQQIVEPLCRKCTYRGRFSSNSQLLRPN